MTRGFNYDQIVSRTLPEVSEVKASHRKRDKKMQLKNKPVKIEKKLKDAETQYEEQLIVQPVLKMKSESQPI